MPFATDAWTAPFRRPGFGPWALAGGASSFSWALSNVIFAWVALVVTTDPLAVGAIFAIRFVALMLFGIPAGVLADRVDRRRMVIAVSLGGAAVAIALGLLAVANGGDLGFPVLAAGSFLLGVLDTGRIAAGTAYTVDLVGPTLATSGIAVTHLVAQAAGIGGNVAGGILLRDVGLAISFVATAVGLLSVAGILAFAPSPEHVRSGDPADRPSLRQAFLLLRRDRLLAWLTLTVIVVEILGFSSMTLLPVFAKDVYEGGPDAYGVLSAVRSLGAVLGLMVLIRIGARFTTGPTLTLMCGLMGAALIVFAVAPWFLVALVPLAVFGAAAASMDSLSQSLMQRATTDAERGAAMGLWTFAVGCGPFGHLAIGAAAGAFGVVATQLVFGGLLVAFAIAMLFVPHIRTLR